MTSAFWLNRSVVLHRLSNGWASRPLNAERFAASLYEGSCVSSEALSGFSLAPEWPVFAFW